MASGEMLKKLLDDFVEKEALVAEELKVITEQIGELEARLEKCRVRLGTIGNDRNRVLEIKQRYASGPFYTRSEMILTGAPVQQIAPQPVAPPEPPPPQPPQAHAEPPQPVYAEPPQPQPQPQVVPPVPEPPKPPVMPEPTPSRNTLTGINALLGARKADSAPVAFSMEQPSPEPEIPQEEPPEPPQPQPQQSQPATSSSEETVVDIEQTQSEDDGDTVKSINDALRSLFR